MFYGIARLMSVEGRPVLDIRGLILIMRRSRGSVRVLAKFENGPEFIKWSRRESTLLKHSFG
jgi:hypothetical protein